MNTAKIISKVTITSLSLINSNKDFDFGCWVIKTPCVFYFHSVKFHYVKETRDINSFLTLVKIVLASQHQKQPNKSLSRFVGNWKHRLGLESARAALCKWATRTCLSKTFANSPNKQKQQETLQKRILDMINHSLGNSEINSIPEWRVFLLNKRKSLRLQQPAWADIIHSDRETKEL